MMAEEFGVPVFPVRVEADASHPGKMVKRPLIKSWQNCGAVTNPEAIEELFSKHPDATHIGLQTGERSRILAIDLDGEPGLEWWRAHGELLPATRTQRTQRAGGKHLIYRMPAGCGLRNSASKIAPGVDIRADGGFIVDWSRDYPPEVADIADAPAALIALLEKATTKVPAVAHPLSVDPIPEGTRNDALIRLGGILRRAGLEGDVIDATLLAVNAQRCNPPLPNTEVSAIARSAASYEPGPSVTEASLIRVPARSPMDWAALEGQAPPPRVWIIPDWIPHSHTTLLAGRAGVGKTLIAQHIGTAIAAGVDYLAAADSRRVLMWAGEDDHRELWYRQKNICSYLNVRLGELSGRFILHSYAGSDITLAAPVFGQLTRTPMLRELHEQVCDCGVELVILDNVARLFGGNENDRHAVTTFIAWLQGACAPAAVILLGHPAKAQGSEFSGSTAWEGAVRARLYLSDRPPDARADEDEAPVDERVRYLARRKANYSPLDLRRFTLCDGVLVPDTVEPTRAAMPSAEFARDVVRRAIQTLANRQIYGAQSTGSPNYLPRLAKQYVLLDRLGEKQFGSVMRSMIIDGAIAREPVGAYPNRTPQFGLVLK
jgi:AAA domain/Bifunctional DNA primase/polymerase, N-terminal/Primase C terminal 1 (PriCT-1)